MPGSGETSRDGFIMCPGRRHLERWHAGKGRQGGLPQQWWVTGRYRLEAQVQAAVGGHVLPPARCQSGAVSQNQRRVCTQVLEVDVA